jgi:non-specific serine/threonine protein kinase
MIARVLGHYRIGECIGRGGMGEVFKGHDTKLDRPVAIKILQSALTGDPASRNRLLRESRIASSFDHPNICTIHQIEETTDGELFLVMTYYQGETLRERIARGPLDLDETLRIFVQLGGALTYAHAAGLVHRDIKPGNVMITRRQEVKILDFGLARTMGDVPITATGVVLGTLEYMAPEVITGGQVDRRADVWSAGVVLYEMLAGQRPFRGDSMPAVLNSILHDNSPDLTRVRADVPRAVAHAVSRALAKDPAERYHSMDEFLADLSVTAPSVPSSSSRVVTQAAPAMRSILVLPFTNLSPDPDTDYFSDGLTEELITDLSLVSTLRVISRTSSLQAAKSKSISAIARDLAVGYVLEGSVRKSASSLRITAKLIDARTESTIWAERYEGESDDVFRFQASLSRRIVEALTVRLSSEEERRFSQQPLSDVYAYECYLKARYETLRCSRSSLDRALEYLRKAEAKVGQNALLTTAMGDVYWQYVNAGITTDQSYLLEAERCAQQLLAKDFESSDGKRLLGLTRVLKGDAQEGIRFLKEAVARNQNNCEALGYLAVGYCMSGRPDAAQPLAERLLDIDPLTPMYQYLPGLVAMMGGRFEDEAFRRASDMDPKNPIIRFYLGVALAMRGDRNGAEATFEALRHEVPDNLFNMLSGALTAALRGDRRKVRSALNADVLNWARLDGYYSWHVGQCHALTGASRLAIEWLENAFARGFINYPLLATHDPLLVSLRTAPRFQTFLTRVERAWKAFVV